MKLEQQQPVARHLSRVYRFGTGAVGLILLAFGIVGFTGDLPFFGTDGNHVFGMSSNGALSVISIVVAVILLGAAAVGGNFASNVALAVSVVFLIGGTVNFALIRTSHNFLNFRLSNVLFSYAVVLLLALVGCYGRFTGGLGHDNPYWRARHPDQLRREQLRARHLHEMQDRQHGVTRISQAEAAEFADQVSSASANALTGSGRPNPTGPAPSADSVRATGAADAKAGVDKAGVDKAGASKAEAANAGATKSRARFRIGR